MRRWRRNWDELCADFTILTSLLSSKARAACPGRRCDRDTRGGRTPARRLGLSDFHQRAYGGGLGEQMIRKSVCAAISIIGLASQPASANDIIAEASLYTVQTTTSVQYGFGSDLKGTSRASGILIDRERGWIATNAHVVKKSPSRVRISFKGNPYLTVEKVYIDSHFDFAIVKIDPDKIPAFARPASLACGDAPIAGTPVIGFGHPWGLEYTATRGIISGVKTLSSIENLQTDTAINPGNSGGALIEERTGKVVGINASGFTNSEGLNFAVPIPLVCTILDLLKAGKNPSPPVLPAKFALTLGDRELVVASVKDDWVSQLKIGDRVVSIDGDPNVKNESRILDKARGKNTLSMTVRRGSEQPTFTLAVPEMLTEIRRSGVAVSGMLVGGSEASNADKSIMRVHMVDSASIAQESQIRYNDQIIAVDGVETKSPQDLMKAFEGKVGKEVELMIRVERPKDADEYDYFSRTIEVRDLKLVDETGVR